MKTDTKKMVTLAVLCAIAYAVMYISRMLPPIVLFLKYDPKDIVIMLGGYIWGPLSAVLMSVVVSFLELITVSETGWIGFIMNVLSTCMFACPAIIIYRKHPGVKTALLGLFCGVLLSTSTMLLWNYLITPLYMKISREAIKAMLVPAFLPFNLIKGTANSAIVLIIFNPLVTALRKAGTIPDSVEMGQKKSYVGMALVAGLVLASCVVFILVLNGIL